MEYTNFESLPEEKIREEFSSNGVFSCTVPYVNRETDSSLSRVLKAILSEINQDKLYSYLEYTQNELSMNASKANSKRLYFESSGLDIENSDDYARGIRTFKKDVFGNFEKYARLHREKETFVTINYAKTDENLTIEILNNSPLLQEEKIRIAERLKQARKFESLAEVLAYGFDETEGAGYGLIVILLMMRKANLDERVLTFQNRDNRGCTTIQIPLAHISGEQGELLAREIIDSIEQMPQFPQNIQMLQKELSNPGCTFESIADTITSDPSLVAEILRIANSPVYRIKNQISDVAAAVRMIGMLGVKSILYNYGARKVFEKKFNKKAIDEINEHSFHVALIASFLAQYKGLNRLAEDIYTAALIHDFGKIIVNSLNRELEGRLEQLCREKHIPIAILDDLASGFNHSTIGAQLARKWDFPDKFIQTIQHHHTPLESVEEYKVITYAVYLGNEIYYYARNERDFDDLNHMVLQFFGISEMKSFQSFLEDMKAEGLNFFF